MRYEDLVRQYLSIRGSSSREWKVSDRMVMCVEIDMSADTHVTMAIASSSSQRRRGMEVLRMTIFVAVRPLKVIRHEGDEEAPEREYHGVTLPMADDATIFLPNGWMTRLEPDEVLMIQSYQSLVERWQRGQLDDLPASTSSEILDKLQRRA